MNEESPADRRGNNPRATITSTTQQAKKKKSQTLDRDQSIRNNLPSEDHCGKIKNIALVEQDKTITLVDQNAGIAIQKGKEDLQKKKYHDAINNFTEAINLHPNNQQVYIQRATALEGQEEWQKAIQDYSRALEIKSDDQRAFANRAKMYQRVYNFGLAIRDLQKVLQLDPQNIEALVSIGQAFRSLQKSQQALENFSQAINIDQSRSELYYLRGKTYEEVGQVQAALEDFKKAIQLQPDSLLFLYNQVRSLILLGNFSKAKKIFTKTILKFKDTPKERLLEEYQMSELRFEQIRQQIQSYQALEDDISKLQKQAQQIDMDELIPKIDDLIQKKQLLVLITIAKNAQKQQGQEDELKREMTQLSKNTQKDLLNYTKIIEKASIKRQEADAALKKQIEANTEAINNLDEIITNLRGEIKLAKKHTYMVDETLEKINQLDQKETQYFKKLYRMMIDHFIAYRVGSTGFFTEQNRALNNKDKAVDEITQHYFSVSRIPIVGSILAIPIHIMQKYQGIKTERLNQNIGTKIRQSYFVNQEIITQMMSYIICKLIEDKKFIFILRKYLQIQAPEEQYSESSQLTLKMKEAKEKIDQIDTMVFQRERIKENSQVEDIVVMHMVAITQKLYTMSLKQFKTASQDRQIFLDVIYKTIINSGSRRPLELDNREATRRLQEQRKTVDMSAEAEQQQVNANPSRQITVKIQKRRKTAKRQTQAIKEESLKGEPSGCCINICN